MEAGGRVEYFNEIITIEIMLQIRLVIQLRT
jgi:hypothetical protein